MIRQNLVLRHTVPCRQDVTEVLRRHATHIISLSGVVCGIYVRSQVRNMAPAEANLHTPVALCAQPCPIDRLLQIGKLPMYALLSASCALNLYRKETLLVGRFTESLSGSLV